MSRVLVIGDIHEPVSHPAYYSFCCDLYYTHDCDTVVFIGDVVDHHAISFHAQHPDAPGALDEFHLAYEKIQDWYAAFPEAQVMVGNHDERVIRLAQSANIPSKFLRDHADVWNTPKWQWLYDTIIDGVYYFHGTGHSGKYPAANVVGKMGMSVVMGHVHAAGGVKPLVNPMSRMFGMDTGCGIDDKAVAFAYGHHLKQRSVLSAGVVIDGMPQYHLMPASRGEPYHRDRF